MSYKRDNCKNIPFRVGCDKCRLQLNECFIFYDMISIKDRYEHMCKHYSNPDFYISSKVCKSYKQITCFEFGRDKCRLCLYLGRYRFDHNKNKIKEHGPKHQS